MGSRSSSFRRSAARASAASAPAAAAAEPPPRRSRHLLLMSMLTLVILIVVANLAITPWVLHIGGRPTPLDRWTGYGSVQASNGGHYLLFTSIRGGLIADSYDIGGCSQLHGCDNLQGSARICTQRGTTYDFQITGQIRTWLNTAGARTSLDLSGGPLPYGLAFEGAWHGPVLRVANADDAFTTTFTPAGAIRPHPNAADDGRASVALRYGSAAAFTAACQTLAG
jgi:hypothetical protein